MIESEKEIIKVQWTHYSLSIRIFLLYFYIFCSEGEFQNLKCEAKRMGATFLPVISHIIVPVQKFNRDLAEIGEISPRSRRDLYCRRDLAEISAR